MKPVCGRYASTKSPAALAEEFDALDATGGEAPGPDYNVAPTKPVISVVARHPRDPEGRADPTTTVRSLRVMRWGLVPYWADDPAIGSRMVNARAESAATKPAFRRPLARPRCLLPAEGWYEWKREGRAKQPYYLTGGASSLALGGLWETWRGRDAPEDEPPLVSCAVLTTAAVGRLTAIHDRMPLVLPRSAWAAWLDPDREDVADLLAPPSAALVDGFELRPVSPLVNDVRRNGPELTEPVEPVLALDL